VKYEKEIYIVVTQNIIRRTFHIAIGQNEGTCFAIDVNNKQYLITAQHLFNHGNVERASVFRNDNWEEIPINLVGHCRNPIDISVFATNFRISDSISPISNMNGLIYGQDAYFLGYPYGLQYDIGELNRNYPLPFIKKATVSLMINDQDNAQFLYLDGHNNPGFSGGPVVFTNRNTNGFQLAAIISGYRTQNQNIYNGNNVLPLTYRYNTGIVIAYSINHAIDLINQNPIGYDII